MSQSPENLAECINDRSVFTFDDWVPENTEDLIYIKVSNKIQCYQPENLVRYLESRPEIYEWVQRPARELNRRVSLTHWTNFKPRRNLTSRYIPLPISQHWIPVVDLLFMLGSKYRYFVFRTDQQRRLGFGRESHTTSDMHGDIAYQTYTLDYINPRHRLNRTFRTPFLNYSDIVRAQEMRLMDRYRAQLSQTQRHTVRPTGRSRGRTARIPLTEAGDLEQRSMRLQRGSAKKTKAKSKKTRTKK
jgi:hypothetical protein